MTMLLWRARLAWLVAALVLTSAIPALSLSAPVPGGLPQTAVPDIDTPSTGLSILEFDALPQEQASQFIVDYIGKLVSGISKRNPQLAREIDQYFFVAPDSTARAPGMIELQGRILAGEEMAAQGKVDLSKIMIQTLVQNVIKAKFLPNK